MIFISTGSEESTEKKKDEMYRVTISRAAETALMVIVDRVNDGFMGGKVNKAEMADWAILRFAEEIGETEVKEIRAEYFDEIAVLESLLRKAKESGKVPTEFKGLLQKQLGLEDSPRKKPKKALTENVNNDYNINNEV